ncbi:uncharacterized protein At3g49140-like [Mercurialis annua]|uniref:uncharacterized protein At3g49140-like n=1 Tax=Mercurialis annua TaxID=3986 RepID=UPI00215E54E3|nr:uncharacterized protein At3g49140-like [Mercurialis annua]
MIETATGVRFSAAALPHYRQWNLEEVNGVSRSSSLPWSKARRLYGSSLVRRGSLLKSRIRACSEKLGSSSDSSKQNVGKSQYHPFEEMAEKISLNDSGDTVLTPQETARTVVEVNSKATLALTGLINDAIHENIIWPDLPYVTDEHGNIYFQVKNDEDILQTLTSENNFVQAIIGFDTLEMMNEMDLLGPSDIDFGIEEIDDLDSDIEDDEDEDEDEDGDDEDYDDDDLVAILDDEDEDSDEALGDWAKLETMRSSHPMYFAKKLAQVTSDDPIDWMEQPPAGLTIQGVIRPALIEEHSGIQKHISGNPSCHADINETGTNVDGKLENDGGINGHKNESGIPEDISKCAEESGNDKAPTNGTSFYKLEMIKIQLISPDGHQTVVEEEDYRKAQPDAIAHSARKIMSRLKAGGEKITETLKSLCWMYKGLQVEEAAVIGVDSLGFDLRVCSGTRVETLRFSFNSRATSEYGAERQLNDILFPRIPRRAPEKKPTHQNEH